jgi:transposase
MKAKLKDKPLNSILDVNIGMPSLSETGVAAFTAVNVLAAYEKQAADILKRDGYPPTIEELWNKKDELLPDLANGKGLAQVYSVFWMLWGLKRVQIDIEKNNADMAVCDMAYALQWATRAQLKPIAGFFEIGKKYSNKQKEIRAKRDKWNGHTKKEIEKIHQEIKSAFASWKKSANAFDIKYAKKYGKSPSAIRKSRES